MTCLFGRVCAQGVERRCLMGEMDLTDSTDAGREADLAGDVERAWRGLGPDALRLAAALVGPHDAHDIIATAFLRVTRQPGWNEIGNRRAYLLRAVRHEAQNLYLAFRTSRMGFGPTFVQGVEVWV